MDGKKLKQKEQQVQRSSRPKALCLLTLITLLFSFNNVFSSELDKVCIYLIKPNVRYNLARTVDNIKENYICYTQELGNDVALMFDSYEDCTVKLKEQNTIERNSKLCYACVELCFNEKVIRIYFTRQGEYYFEGQWYSRNNGLFYNLFSMFSNEYVLNEVIELSKKCRYDQFWNANDFLSCEKKE